jgi:SAM-dependent methyltransferase
MYSKAALQAGTQAHYADPSLYDHTYRHRRKDVAFYADLCESRGGPVLELGCGTGRVTLPVARRGIDIVGIDPMPTMLAQAEARAQALPRAVRSHVRFVQGDLLRLRLRKRFALVISPFHVFMHLYTREDMQHALATVRRHLQPGGLFVFDVLVPDLHLLTRDPNREYKLRDVRHPTEKKAYRYRESFEYDAVQQVQWIHMRFEDAAAPRRSFVTPLAHSQWYPRELETILHYNGFDLVERYGDFDRSPLTSESLSQILVARPRR